MLSTFDVLSIDDDHIKRECNKKVKPTVERRRFNIECVVDFGVDFIRCYSFPLFVETKENFICSSYLPR